MRFRFLVASLVLVIIAGCNFLEKESIKVSNFQECMEAGYVVMESDPMQCRDNDGNLHIEEKDESEVPEDVAEYIESKSDMIVVESPSPLEVVNSPLEFSGEARGQWFFEGSFSVLLTDWDGRIISEGIASLAGDEESWMTEEFVGFEGSLEFENPSFEDEFSKRGTLIFEKSNPSGIPSNDDALEIPVRFE